MTRVSTFLSLSKLSESHQEQTGCQLYNQVSNMTTFDRQSILFTPFTFTQEVKSFKLFITLCSYIIMIIFLICHDPHCLDGRSGTSRQLKVPGAPITMLTSAWPTNREPGNFGSEHHPELRGQGLVVGQQSAALDVRTWSPVSATQFTCDLCPANISRPHHDAVCSPPAGPHNLCQGAK